MLCQAFHRASRHMYTIRKQVNVIGVDRVADEEFYMNYGTEGLFLFFFVAKS